MNKYLHKHIVSLFVYFFYMEKRMCLVNLPTIYENYILENISSKPTFYSKLMFHPLFSSSIISDDLLTFICSFLFYISLFYMKLLGYLVKHMLRTKYECINRNLKYVCMRCKKRVVHLYYQRQQRCFIHHAGPGSGIKLTRPCDMQRNANHCANSSSHEM